MTAHILDGRALAQELKAAAQTKIAVLTEQLGRAPSLVVVQMGNDPASSRYVRTIGKLCNSVGATFHLELLSPEATQAELMEIISTLNGEQAVDGILVQLPLPGHIDATEAILTINYQKDIDGVHPINAGLLAQGRPSIVPNTPAGGMELLRRNQIVLRGKRAAVVGRSAIVGRPMAQLLLQADATVTICHSRTPNLGEVLRECDIVCVAVGKPGLITAEMIRPGAVVVDFGTNVRDDGSLVGDVDFASVVEIAGAITPVPGGTGPVTNTMLLNNLINAARSRLAS